MGQGPIHCTELTFPIFISNLTNKEQIIPMHTAVGKLDPLKNYEIPKPMNNFVKWMKRILSL